MRALAAQTRAELLLTLRRGESVLLALGIPILLLVFFSSVDILPKAAGAKDPIDFLARACSRSPSCPPRWSASESPPASSASTAC